MRDWHLTPLAQASLVDIALWTIDTFGEHQVNLYEAELIDRCEAIAAGRVMLRDCSILLHSANATGHSYARAGEHFVIVVDDPHDLAIVDFLHSRSDLPRHIASLVALTSLE